MANVKVCSREYKIMLNASRFAGDEGQVVKAAGEFWAECSRKVGPAVLGMVGELKDVHARRVIRFFDTPGGRNLNSGDFIVRERVGQNDGSREITLKFRHPDRYIAADRGQQLIQPGKTKNKFEEDIKPQFQQLYSFSSTIKVPADQKLTRMKHVADLFQGFKSAFRGYRENDPLEVVGDFAARELVIGGGSLYLGKRFGVYASCVLVVWHDHRNDGRSPAVAEFSFKYGDENETYSGGTVRRAYDAFQCLQTQMPDWIDAKSSTKTAFVYS